MTDFVFRNLSVRLSQDPNACDDRATNFCAPCSNNPSHVPCQPPPQPSATFPASLDTGGLCFDSITTPVYGCEDDLQQLAMLKDAMRQQLELVEARLAELRPQSVEEIDQLKARLLEAVAELDERREQQS